MTIPAARSVPVGCQLRHGGRAGVGEERPAALRLLVLADPAGREAQRVQRPQETAVRLVLPGDRAVPLPAVAAQGVQSPVVAGPGVRVALDRATGGERLL